MLYGDPLDTGRMKPDYKDMLGVASVVCALRGSLKTTTNFI